MADTMGRPAKAPKKKKALAFLSSTPKPAPTLNCFEDEGEDDRKEEDEEDSLNLFRRSKDYFPVVIKEQEEEPRDATPEPKDEKKHAADDDDEEPIFSSARSSKRRRLSSPHPVTKGPLRESYEDLYGPATPPRRLSKSPPPTPRSSHVKRSPPATDRRTKQASPASEKGKGKERIELVQSDILPTPSRSNSHQLPAEDVVVLDDDHDPFEEDAPDANALPAAKILNQSPPGQEEENSPGVIDLADSDDDLIETDPKPKEDEFAHFIIRAAEKEAAAKAAAAALSPPDADSTDEEQSSTPDAARARRKKREPIVVVRIFVQSRLSGEYSGKTTFGVKRGLHQDLGTVRLAFIQWARKEGIEISEDMERDVFLTWKGRRIYDSASGISLGWQPTATGEFSHTTTARVPGFDRGGILLEAWTQEQFARYTADQERQRLIDRGELVEEGVAAEDDDAGGEQHEPEVAKVKLFLKEKDTEPLRLTLWSDMPVRILSGAYKKQRKVPEDREIKLRYEGEWLHPDMTVAEAEIEDMCTVEVYVR